MAAEKVSRPPGGAGDPGRRRSRRAVAGIAAPARLAAVAATQLLDTAAEPDFDELAALAAKLTGLPLAFITLVDDRRSYWKSAIGTGIADEDTVTRQNAVSESFCQYVVESDGPIVVTDAASDPLTRDNPSVTSMGVRAWAGFPVRSPDGYVLGSFCVVDTVPRVFSQHDLDVLEVLARAANREVALRAALATSTHLGERAAAANNRLRLLAQASARLGESLQPTRIIETLGDLVIPDLGSWLVVGFPGSIAAAVFGAEPADADSVVVVAALHNDPVRARALQEALRDFPQSTSDSHGIGHVIATGRAQFRRGVDVAMDFPRARDRSTSRLLELAGDADSALTVPLSLGGRVLGAMTIGLAQGTELQRELLGDLAGRAAMALDHAFDYDRQHRAAAEQAQRSRRAEQLTRAGAALHRKLDPVDELQALAGVIVPDLADMCTVHLLREPVTPGTLPPLPVLTDRVAAKVIPGVELPAQDVGLSWAGDGDPIVEAIRHGRLLPAAITVPAVPEWALRAGGAGTVRSGLHHLVAAPVLVDGLVVAVACFGMCHQRMPWSQDDLDTLAEIARYAGIALRHGLDYQRTRESTLILQRSLLTDPPNVSGLATCARYQPAGHDEVGGDWYDMFAIGEDDIALVVGDVVGHDITAAAAMGQLRAAVRSVVCDSDTASPGAVLDRVAAVNRRLGITSFATMFHARLTRTDGLWTLRWSNAGHPPPVLVSPAGKARLLEGPGGIPVNPWRELPHPDFEIALEPGSTLLLYTDGLVERRGTDIAANISALQARAASAIDLGIGDFCEAVLSDATAEDDIALLAVHLKDQ